MVAGVGSGGKVGGINRRRTDLQASENTLYVESRHTFAQTYRMHMPRVSPEASYGSGGIMMCQCRFIGCNNRHILLGDAEKGEGCACVRSAGI